MSEAKCGSASPDIAEFIIGRRFAPTRWLIRASLAKVWRDCDFGVPEGPLICLGNVPEVECEKHVHHCADAFDRGAYRVPAHTARVRGKRSIHDNVRDSHEFGRNVVPRRYRQCNIALPRRQDGLRQGMSLHRGMHVTERSVLALDRFNACSFRCRGPTLYDQQRRPIGKSRGTASRTSSPSLITLFV
jgi:hypothetical protein